MTKSIRRGTAMWEYLEKSGVLESGSEEDITQAKAQYKKIYQREYRKQRRQVKPEVRISLDREDWLKLTHAAQQHHYTLPAFIKHAALSYLNQTYLVPDREPITRMEQRLRLCQTDIRVIARHVHKRNLPELKQAYLDLAVRIGNLEEYLNQVLKNPPKIS